MRFKLRKIHHLIRYFVLLGVAAFFAYLKQWNDEITFYVIGPPLYLGYFLKQLISGYVSLPNYANFNHFAILLPVTVFYFGLLGTLLKILWNEYGGMRVPTLLAYWGFLIFIHYFAAQNLLAYFEVYP